MHRVQELGLSAITRMPNLDDFTAMANSQGARSSVVSDRDQPPGPKKPNQFRQELFTGAPLVSQLRSAGIVAPIVGSQAFDAQKLLEIAGPAVEGVYIVAGLNRDRDSAELKDYLAEFQKRAGYGGENVGATVYSAFRLMADAMTRANSLDQAKVRDALAATQNFPHLDGLLVSFNSLREINMALNVNVVKGGKFQHYAWIDDLKLLAPPTE